MKFMRLFVVLIGAFFLASLTALAAPLTLQVTIGASATQLSTATQNCSWFVVQNNATHNIRVGDSSVTTSKGVLLVPGASWQVPLVQPGTTFNLTQWYVAGTQSDVVDVTCYTVNF